MSMVVWTMHSVLEFATQEVSSLVALIVFLVSFLVQVNGEDLSLHFFQGTAEERVQWQGEHPF